MEYILGVLIVAGLLCLVTRLWIEKLAVSPKWLWLGFWVGVGYLLLAAPYRLARIWHDVMRWLN